MSLSPKQRIWLAWIGVVSIFFLGVIFEVAFYGRLILVGFAPWLVNHLPEPFGEALALFGHAPIAAALGFFILLQTYESTGKGMTSGAIGILVLLSLVAAYLGVFFAVNTYGE